MISAVRLSTPPQENPIGASLRVLRRRRIARLLPLLLLTPGLLRAQAQPEIVGRIEGEDIAVKGAVGADVEGGRSRTVLSSGSEVTVRSGQARLVLAEGGEIGICAPAHFSLLKSGGAVTLALDYGRIHARLEHRAPLIIYTPLIVASPIVIGDRMRDTTVGLDVNGAMCVLAASGAVRVEQQLTGQSILVPQGGEVALVGGQLDSLRGTAQGCQCDLLSARANPPPPRRKPAELSVLARPGKPLEKPAAKEEVKPPAIEAPIYKIMMPPLTFDAAAPAPPPTPSPETILLLREVRVRQAEVFIGRVESPPTPQPARSSVSEEDAPPKKHATVGSKIGNFFRRLFGSRGPCAGAGCGAAR
jgi:hypothetical protein